MIYDIFDEAIVCGKVVGRLLNPGSMGGRELRHCCLHTELLWCSVYMHKNNVFT